MKQLTMAILTLLTLILTGCANGQISTDNRLDDREDTIMKVEYEGHSYIIYKGHYKGGIIHDPGCQCQKKEESNGKAQKMKVIT